MGFPLKYSIIIGCYNNKDHTKACLDSVLKYSDLSTLEIIVVANGCTDGTLEMLENEYLDYIRLFSWDSPLGYAGAYNEGIKKAQGEYIVLLNNDTLLLHQSTNDWLERLEAPFTKNPSVGISGPLSLTYDDKKFIVFFCAMVHRSVIDKIGRLDTTFPVGGGEDVDFCWRAVDAGFELADVVTSRELVDGRWISDYPMFHTGGATVHGLADWEDTFKANIEKVIAKHKKPVAADKLNRVVHIIMPAYNCVSTIERSVRAIQEQTHTNWVLHITDDHSTDGTWEWLQDWASWWNCDAGYCIRSGPLHVYRTDKNRGAAGARNKALEHIGDNEIVALCDADDVWHPNHLVTSMAALVADSIDLVYCDPTCRTSTGEQVWPTFPVPKGAFDREQLRWNNFIFPSTVVFKNDGYRFNEKANKLEDWELFIRMVKAGKKFVKKEPSSVDYLVNTGETNNGAGGDLVVPIIKALHPDFVLSNPPIKLNLGCGQDTYKGYVNIDLYDDHADLMMPAEKLVLPDNFADEIVANHIIEHYPYCQIWDVLREWCRVLKVGGRIEIETPDFIESCRGMVEGPEEKRLLLYGHFFATPWDIPGQVHRFLFTEHNLIWTMQQCGFKNVRRVPPKSSYTRYVEPDFLKYFLRVEGTR